ncbi:MAG: hypothetical protein PSW75_12405 [bacterium]|nr:hypothetical protein [bacterium]
MRSQLRNQATGFTLVEVMMASVILVAGFIGMIEAVTVSSGMMDHARRQTLADQIVNHEIGKLRFASWTTISALPTASTSVAIDTPFWPVWSSAATYAVNRVVSYGGANYRCILAHTGQTPPNATYWTATTTAVTTDTVVTQGATFSLTRTVTSPDPVTNIREVNFTVTWVVATSRRDAGGSQLTFTYTRSSSAWYGKYGLNLSYQRS